MDTTLCLMREALEQLVSTDLKKFVWHQWNGVVADIDPIPRSALEEADRQDVVDWYRSTARMLGLLLYKCCSKSARTI